MNWKKYDEFIRQFARDLNCEVDEESVHAIGQTIQFLTFVEKDIIKYEFRHSKPITSIGSQIKLESEKGEKDYYIMSRQKLFFKPQLKIKIGQPDSDIRDKLLLLQKEIEEFEWRTNGVLKFTAKFMDLNAETLHLIRDIHLRLKE